MNSRLPASLTLSFTGFSQRGGCTDHHADGWGIAFFESHGEQPGKGVRYFVDKQSAATSPLAQMLRTFPIKSHNVVAHVRKATVGHVMLENSHPFVRELWGRYWVFAHNGDLKDYAPPLHGSFKPVGDTDSELAFCWLLQELAKSHAGVPSVAELSLTLRELVPQITRHVELVRRTVELAEDGRPSKEALAKQLGVAPFRAQKMLVAVGHWTPADASRAMSCMHEADAAMKGMSRMPPALALERALADAL